MAQWPTTIAASHQYDCVNCDIRNNSQCGKGKMACAYKESLPPISDTELRNISTKRLLMGEPVYHYWQLQTAEDRDHNRFVANPEDEERYYAFDRP